MLASHVSMTVGVFYEVTDQITEKRVRINLDAVSSMEPLEEGPYKMQIEMITGMVYLSKVSLSEFNFLLPVTTMLQ